MVDNNEKRRISQEVFAITGVAVPENDPLIVAALFYAKNMRDASRLAAEHVAEAIRAAQTAVDEARKAAAEATAITRLSAADGKARVDAIEARVKKAIREAGRFQSSQEGPPTGWRGVLAGVALGVFIAGGVVSVACNFSFSWIADARFGAEVKRAMPTFKPSFRDKLIEHLEKRRR